jgi:hypothetical protein
MSINRWVTARLTRAANKALSPEPQPDMPIGPLEPISDMANIKIDPVDQIMQKAIDGSIEHELGQIINRKLGRRR